MSSQASQFSLRAARLAAVIATAAWRSATGATDTSLNVKNDVNVASFTVQDIKFRDSFQSPIGAPGLELSEPLRAVAGQRVRLAGYTIAQEDAPTGRFFYASANSHERACRRRC